MSIKFRRLNTKMITDDFLSDFNRHQEISKVFRSKGGIWVIHDNVFTEDWDNIKKSQIIDGLRDTLLNRGILYAAYDDNKLVGFAGIEGKLFGSENQYVELSSLQVSNEYRGNGIGRKLFDLCKSAAASYGAKKLYISAHSSVESQAFYRAMGCTEVLEYNDDLYAKEPYDCHLECPIPPSYNSISIYMCLGLALGLCFGIPYSDKGPVFMCIGMALGVAVGYFIDSSKIKEAKNAPRGNEIKEGGENRHPDNL